MLPSLSRASKLSLARKRRSRKASTTVTPRTRDAGFIPSTDGMGQVSGVTPLSPPPLNRPSPEYPVTRRMCETYFTCAQGRRRALHAAVSPLRPSPSPRGLGPPRRPARTRVTFYMRWRVPPYLFYPDSDLAALPALSIKPLVAEPPAALI